MFFFNVGKGTTLFNHYSNCRTNCASEKKKLSCLIIIISIIPDYMGVHVLQ